MSESVYEWIRVTFSRKDSVSTGQVGTVRMQTQKTEPCQRCVTGGQSTVSPVGPLCAALMLTQDNEKTTLPHPVSHTHTHTGRCTHHTCPVTHMHTRVHTPPPHTCTHTHSTHPPHHTPPFEHPFAAPWRLSPRRALRACGGSEGVSGRRAVQLFSVWVSGQNQNLHKRVFLAQCARGFLRTPTGPAFVPLQLQPRVTRLQASLLINWYL